MDKGKREAFTAIVVCPDCGTEHVAPYESPGHPEIPEFCGCGCRIWTPVSPGKDRA